jgi:single-strand DNA-binding protein
MAFLNKVMLIGRLTDNPEPPRVLPNSGSTVVKFRFAVGRSKKNPQTGQWENDPNPLYIDCEAWGKPDYQGLVNLISQYCTKGKEVLIEGRLQLDSWDDKTSGQKRSKHKIVVENVQLLGGKDAGDEGQERPQGGYQQRPAGGGQQGGYRPAPAFLPTDDGEGYSDIPF